MNKELKRHFDLVSYPTPLELIELSLKSGIGAVQLSKLFTLKRMIWRREGKPIPSENRIQNETTYKKLISFFSLNKKPSEEDIIGMAKSIKETPQRVKNWFRRKRAVAKMLQKKSGGSRVGTLNGQKQHPPAREPLSTIPLWHI